MTRLMIATVSTLALGTAAFAATDLSDLDADGDGVASMEEVMAMNPSITATEFEQVDVNRSNSWDSDEIYSAQAQGYLSRNEGTETQDFSSLDTDGDGAISFAEIQIMNPDIIQTEFDMIDVNDSGTWDADELNTIEAKGYLSASAMPDEQEPGTALPDEDDENDEPGDDVDG